MHVGIWYALGAIVFLLILFILFDNRKKIFKKREKKSKPETEIKDSKPAETKEKTKEVKKISNSKMSLTKKVKKEAEKEPEAEVEDADFDGFDEEPITYQKSSSIGPIPRRRPVPLQFDRSKIEREYTMENSKKKSIKKQIKDLSPEMKAILFTDALGKRDDK